MRDKWPTCFWCGKNLVSTTYPNGISYSEKDKSRPYFASKEAGLQAMLAGEFADCADCAVPEPVETPMSFNIKNLIIELIKNDKGEVEQVCFKFKTPRCSHLNTDEIYAFMAWLEPKLPFQE